MIYKVFLLLAHSTLISALSDPVDCKCNPKSSCWPSDADWKIFNQSLSGALVSGLPPGSVCYPDQPSYNESLCDIALQQWTNSTWHASNPVSIDYTFWANNSCNPIYHNGTDINGNPNAGAEGCTIGNYPVYVVNATQAEHVSTALKWAAQNNIRVVVKNTGHNFLGRSTGYGSLSIWTHNLRGIEYEQNFQPDSCSMNQTFQAMRIGAGEVGIDVQAEASKYGVVVSQGGNTDVGLAGWMTGGGHGYLSSTYGMGADNLLEATIATPDGRVLTVNPCQNEDLYYATRGGGGGTYGVLLSAVIRAYPTPQTTTHDFNITLLDPSQESVFWDAIGFVHSQMPSLKGAGMSGYYFIYGPPTISTLYFSWTFHIYDKSNGTIETLMRPIEARLNSTASILSYGQEISWFPTFFAAYGNTAPEGVGTPAAAMGSRLLTAESLSDETRVASVLASIGPGMKFANESIPYQGGVLVGSMTAANQIPSFYPELISMLPAWRNTTVHLANTLVWDETLSQTSVNEIFQDITWNKTQPLRDLSPTTGAYLNECDYFEPNWQASLYGSNYARLYEIKQKYDPNGVFWCERCVGSEAWSQMEDNTICRSYGY